MVLRKKTYKYMPFSCSRCGYTSKFKHHVCAHIQRKKLCIPLISDIAPNVLSQTVGKNIDTCDKNIDTCDKNIDICDKNVDTCDKNIDKKDDKINIPVGLDKVFGENQCMVCEKVYTSKKGLRIHVCKGPKSKQHRCPICDAHITNGQLSRHIKSCKVSKKAQNQTVIEDKDNEIKQLKEELQNTRLIINNTTNNITNITNNTNNTINVTINGFGNEHTDHLTQLVNRQLVNGSAYDFGRKLFYVLYVHPQVPENHCLRKTNVRGEYIQIDKKDHEGNLITEHVRDTKALDNILNQSLHVYREKILGDLEYEGDLDTSWEHFVRLKNDGSETNVEKQKLRKTVKLNIKDQILNHTKIAKNM